MPLMRRSRSINVCCIIGPTQIEIAMLEPQLFVRQILRVGVRRNRRREAFIQQLESGDAELDVASREARIGHAARALGDFAGDLDHVLGPKLFALVDDRLRCVGRVEYDLRHAVAVAQIDEQSAAVVAVAVDPAAERGFLADMFAAQFTAGMSSQHGLPRK